MAIQHCAVQTKAFCLLSSHLETSAVGRTAFLLRLFLHRFACLGRIFTFESSHGLSPAWSVGASHSVGSAQVQTCLLPYWTTDPAGNISPFRIKRA